jgi:hypothetical protein
MGASGGNEAYCMRGARVSLPPPLLSDVIRCRACELLRCGPRRCQPTLSVVTIDTTVVALCTPSLTVVGGALPESVGLGPRAEAARGARPALFKRGDTLHQFAPQ